MPGDPPRPTPRSLEPEVRRLWAARRLPPKGGVIGRGDGPLVRQIEGTYVPGDAPTLVAHRAVLADVDARYLSLSGRSAVGTLRSEPGGPGGPFAPIGPVLESLGVWTGGAGDHPWDESDQRSGVQAVVARLAHRGILVMRDGPLRICLACRVPRTPERIIYQKEIGDTYLVRFPLAGSDPVVEALVWVDAPWRLLGASALLVHPDLVYAVAEYRRRGASVTILVSRGALDRLRAWLTDAELVVREEKPGRDWVGRPYTYPLRHEFPIGGSLDPPAGTIQADTGVGDSGTGIVPLVPGHGPTDAEIAARLGIAGWPLLTSRGILDASLMHKYAGLDVDTANEFVSRDLTEGGSVLARLRVVRGVPYCAICGHRIVWAPGRAWCLEPGNLPPDQRERYGRLLPHDRPLAQIEISRWPVSETTPTREAGAPVLLECARCERLDAPDAPRQCPCGGTRRSVARRLLPSMAGAIAAWCRNEPIARTDIVRVYANERRRVPSLAHSLAAMAGVDAATSDFGLTRAPTVSRVDLPTLTEAYGADAVRSAFVRTATGDGDTANFEHRCRQEQERLARLLEGALGVLSQCDAPLVREGAQPPDRAARDLEVEDRAVLARWARAHLQVFAAYDRWDPAGAHRRLFRFLEHDLVRYLELIRPRLGLAGNAPTKRAALRTLLYVFRSSAGALAPIAPFTAESIHRRFLQEPRSLFEGIDLTADRALADEGASAAWDRWLAVVSAIDRFRHAHGLAAELPIEAAAVTVLDEDVAEKLRGDRPTIERLARVGRFDVGSPKVPWEGRHRQIVPVEREIQRAYPALTTQIVRLLEHLPPRSGSDTTAKPLTVFVSGAPHTITPEMFLTVETLPENFVPTPFSLGEMFVRSPGLPPGRAPPPPLSPDAFWLVRRVAHRLAAARAEEDETYRVAIAVAVDPLASELRQKAEPIAQYLGIEEFRVEEEVAEAIPPDRVTGRTRTGARWWVAVPGMHGRRRPAKRRAARSDGRRVRPPIPAPPSEETDYADEKVIARAEAIRNLGQELDTLLGVPVLGPSKIEIAWEAGLQSMHQFREAPFDQVATLPGFGRPVAATLWSKLGKPAPPPSSRSHGPESSPTSSTAAPRAARRGEMKSAPSPEPIPRPRASPRVTGRERPPPTLPEATMPVAPGPTAPTEPAVPPEGVSTGLSGPPPVGEGPTPTSATTPPGPPEPQETVPAETGPVVEGSTDGVGPTGPETTPTPPVGEGTPTAPEPEAAPAAQGSPPEGPPKEREEAEVEAPEAEVVPPAASAEVPISSEPTPSGVPADVELPVAAGEATESVEPSEVSVSSPDTGATVPVSTPGTAGTAFEPPGPAPLTDVTEAGEPAPSPPPTSGREEPEPPTPESPVASAPEIPPVTETTDRSVAQEPEDLAPLSGLPSEPNAEAGALESIVAPSEPPPVAEQAAAASEEAGVPSEPSEAPDLPKAPEAPPTERALVAPERRAPVVRSEATLPAPRPDQALVVPENPGGLAPTPAEPPAAEIGPSPPMPVTPPVIAPPPPAPTEEEVRPTGPPPPPSGIEFDASPTLFGALQPFLDATAAGHRGLAIVRELPERIRTHVGPRPVDVLWLSNLERNRTLRPSDLGEIVRRVERALTEEGVTAFFIEGAEYLVRIHGVDRVVEFLRAIDEAARDHDARVWLHVTPGLLPEPDLERIRSGVSARAEGT